ncbi:biotin carboxylase N-terminal domain-containing protein [Mycobacterium sp. 1274756.6]|uniref:acetyl/propionyl/methylcrotonyl-CoA carboxylase subunit alpha n=1 Tax=Mycobacterium sp. 1274756.6 TaxID=1834076 RepID=UPI0007FEF281|nr:biotin carboxylase N-terminal domain-containing protein [Mycobacterium sp. 1274756.6]OBJ68025.1 3-methylcrotonyl-CoA carboxylase [Mycobacterium sp. 1274756.6]
MRFDTLLIANRGEIAVRVIRTAQDQGYRTVAVYSDADADAPHVSAADTAVHLGPARASESYLDADKIIAAAKASGAQAVHPGYGFLSERAEFAQACADAGIVFIGPTPEAIRAMGDKAASKRLMADAGVPMLPGYQGEDQSDERLLVEAARVGLPLMVKASAGGGGKGMRLATRPDEVPDAIAAARREALSAFGSDVLLLERALFGPRHVEIQVLGDEHGNVIALGERDCSVQRRHQKVVEESPSPALTPELRQKMCDAGVAAAASIGYVGAGTVEFLLDADGEFYFLEMNTRLQVEHPVTEFVTGLDLVDAQLRIAQGEQLQLAGGDVELGGHAIEARLYAEDPYNDYLPVTGDVVAFEPPVGDGIRVDSGIATGSTVGSHYDPLLAKIIAHGANREQARRRLISALERTRIFGLTTNRTFLIDILRHDRFAESEATTAFLDQVSLTERREPSTRHLAVAAGWLHRERERAAARRTPGLAGWTNGAEMHSVMVLGGEEIQLLRNGAGLTVTIAGARHQVGLAEPLTVDGVVADAQALCIGHDRIMLAFRDLDLDLRDTLLDPPDAAAAAGSGVLLSPMHGTVTNVFAHVGDTVEAGTPLMVLEAMKMERPVVADVPGVVDEIATAGLQVAADEVLVRIRAAEEA